MKKFWQGHDPEELLLALVAMLFVVGLALGLLHISMVDRSIIVR